MIYTPWSNLKKDGSMAVGQVGFKDPKKAGYSLIISFYRTGRNLTKPKVKKVHVPERANVIVNRLNKTRVEKYPNLRQEKEDRQKELRHKDRAAQLARVRCTTVACICSHKLTGRPRLAEGRSSRSEGAEGESVAAGSCLRRSAF